MKRDKISIAIADDHFVCRDGLKSILNEDAYHIVGEAKTGVEILEIVEQFRPEIVFLDIQMPEMDGAESAKRIQIISPLTSIIVLTMYGQESMVMDMIKAGVKGYLLKSAEKKEILEAITMVLKNINYYSREIHLSFGGKIKNWESNRTKDYVLGLSETDVQIIRLICEEYTSEAIGKVLYLSKRTIDGARLRIQEKLNVSSIAGIVKYANENRIYTR